MSLRLELTRLLLKTKTMEVMESRQPAKKLIGEFLLYVGEVISLDLPDEEIRKVVNQHSIADVCDFFVEQRIMDHLAADILDKQLNNNDIYDLLQAVSKALNENPTPSTDSPFLISRDTLINIRNALRPKGNQNGPAEAAPPS